MLIVVPISLALGIVVLLLRWDIQRVTERFERATDVALEELPLHDKALPRTERVLRPWRSLGLVHFAARTEECDRVRHVLTCDTRMFGLMRNFTLCMVPDYRYNLPIFSADMMYIGPLRVLVVELIDPTRTEAAHLQHGYQLLRQHRRRFADVLPLRDVETTPWARDMLHDSSFIVVARRRQDQLLLQLFQDYLSTWLDMARAAPPLAPEMQPRMQAGVEHYVDMLLEHGGPAVNFERRVLGPDKTRRWVRTVGFGLAA